MEKQVKLINGDQLITIKQFGKKTNTIWGSLEEVGKTKRKDEREFKDSDEARKYLIDFVAKQENKGYSQTTKGLTQLGKDYLENKKKQGVVNSSSESSFR